MDFFHFLEPPSGIEDHEGFQHLIINDNVYYIYI